MKLIKKIIILSLFIYLLPVKVSAGSLYFGNTESISYNKYKFSLYVKDIELNYIKGSINVTNGTVTNITTSSGWINKTGSSNNFYFYHDGIKKGEYVVATFEVTMSMTGDSRYSIGDINYGAYSCQKDNYGNYFGENGNIVSELTFNNTCNKSKDATLKSLSLSTGTLSPSFSPDNIYYTVNVSSDTNIIVFDPVPNDKLASVVGKKCELSSNITDCNIKVTAEAGNTKTYYITVFKESSDADFIKNFKVHNGVLDKEFDINTFKYYLTPDKNAEHIYFSFILNGTNYTTDKCSASSANCKVMVSSGNIKKEFTFYILNDEENEVSKQTTSTSTNSSKTKTNNTLTKNSSSKKENKKNEEKIKEKTESEESEKTINPIEYNKEKDSKDKENESSDITKEVVIEEKMINKNEDKNNFLKILCIVNVFLGIVIGAFFKNRTNKK